MKAVSLKNIDPVNLPWDWAEVKDHAKWALSESGAWICVGDINRMISQRKRGGCTIAFQDQALWAQLKKADIITPPPGSSWSAEDTKKVIAQTNWTPDTTNL